MRFQVAKGVLRVTQLARYTWALRTGGRVMGTQATVAPGRCVVGGGKARGWSGAAWTLGP